MKRTTGGARNDRAAMVDPATAPSFSDVEAGEGGNRIRPLAMARPRPKPADMAPPTASRLQAIPQR